MHRIEGKIVRIIFRSDTNNYTVLHLSTGDTVCGCLPSVSVGDTLKAEGKWVKHKRYGNQFQVTSLDESSSLTNNDLVKFLGSGIIKGIKNETALQLVKHFGEDVFNVLENNPDKLLSIKGIGNKKLAMIKSSWNNISKEVEPLFFLLNLGFSLTLAKKVYNTYKEKTVEIIRSNPYKMIGDVWGIGFERADKIAAKLGIGDSDKERIKAWVLYHLIDFSQQGNTFIQFGTLYQRCGNALGYQLSEDDVVLYELEKEGEIIVRNGNIYLSELYFIEREIEAKTEALTNMRNSFTVDLISHSDELSDEQIEAVTGVFSSGITIITGGPGTGKTTSIKSIYETCKKLNLKCALAAPTGRAAKRISQVIGAEAKTIHRLLEYNPAENYFFYNEDNPLEIDALIVDEISMVDIVLFHRLLSALTLQTRLILLGDVDQLPAIGPGDVMKNLINSGKIPVYELKKIFRQAEGSGIIELAALIRENAEIDLTEEFEGVEFIEAEKEVDIQENLLNRFATLVETEEFDPIFEVQVISPVYKGEAGVDKLNALLQQMLNAYGNKVPFGYNKLRIHDKVMQLRNNYNKNIFNGDVGIVQHFDEEEGKVFVLFDNKIVDFREEELDEIRLAYAATVHKSQGSEYNCIILVINPAHNFMLTKNLIYTAITRAKRKLIIIGSKEAFVKGVRNLREAKRFTSLFHH